MANNKNDNCTRSFAGNASGFREAVCIDTRRIYDACSDKDCIKDLRVYFTGAGQLIIDAATNIKARCAEAVGVFFEVEPVAFNKGFFAIDITFFFKVTFAAYSSPAASPVCVDGLATFSKKVILFGSEASVKTFSTEDFTASCGKNSPIVNVQVIDPMILACYINECNPHPCQQNFVPPPAIAEQFEGCFDGFVPHRTVCLTLGLFSIVQLERQVQVMVPVYGFCIPDKQCSGSGSDVTDDPCELFSKVSFPTDEFFPPKLTDICE